MRIAKDIPPRDSESHADMHRHQILKRSGAHYVVGETIEKEEDNVFEFKAVQISANPVLQILRYASKYVAAFCNANGGRLMFGVEDNGVVKGIELNRSDRDGLRLGMDRLGFFFLCMCCFWYSLTMNA